MMKSTLFGVALLLTLGCSSGGEEPPAPAADGGSPASAEGGRPPRSAEQAGRPRAAAYGSERLAPEIAALDIRNVHQMSPDLLTGGQLSKEQMTQLHQLGYRTFINLRQADEPGTGWEEEFAAAEGIVFHRIPVAGARGITRRNAQQLARFLEEAGDQPVAVYCASGNRVGALLAMKAHYLDGLNVDEAVVYGVKAGMTRLEPVVRGRLSAE